MPSGSRRSKLSTTATPENLAFLKSLVKRGVATTLGEALDWCVESARREGNRQRLEAATEAYYASLSGEALAEEQRLEIALAYEAGLVNFDE